MNQTIVDLLNAVDQTSLTPFVQAALNQDAVQVIDWQYEKIHGGGGDAYDAGQAGVYRFWGGATIKDKVHDWQLLLKVLDQSTGQLEPSQLYYWQREPIFYGSKFLSTVPSGLVAPRCLGVEQPSEDIIWLWLEYVVDAFNNQWDLDRFGTVARHLGQFNGSWLVSKDKPPMTWFSNGRVAPWLEMAAPHIERIPSLLDHASIRRWLTPTNATHTLELWARRAELLAIQDRLPKTICHHDAHRRNLFARIDHNAYSQTVAIDWAFAGVGALGADIATLMAVDVQFGETKADKLPQLDQVIFAGYLSGLLEAGWPGDEKIVRLGFTVSAALTWALSTLWWMIPAVVDPDFQRVTEAVLGIAIDDLVDEWAGLQAYLLDLAVEALNLAKHV